MRYAGHEGWEPKGNRYMVVDDGINHLQDCDIWFVVSDRLEAPLLPMRPSVLMIYDYLQRYVPILPFGADQSYLDAARSASKILVTTEFTKQDALSYAGITADKVFKLPMLAPDFSRLKGGRPESANYFLWTTNAAIHKNHVNALKALKFYYEELDGALECRITGVNTKDLFKSSVPHLKPLATLLGQSRLLKKNIKLLGELPDRNYQSMLASAAFLWHAGAIDNGTFSVIEAAGLGIPSLSSDYPSMREIDQQFSLNLNWMKSDQPKHMASQLKEMELTHLERRDILPPGEVLGEQSVEKLANVYWQVVRECL